MSEQRLRDLLERAVPEAPEIKADVVPARAAAVQRRQVVAGGVAVAVVAAGVVGGVSLGGDGEDEVANNIATAPSGSTAPYDVPVCPARLPDVGKAPTVVPDLSQVVAIRSCPDLVGPDLGRSPAAPPRPDEVALLADHDALVIGLDEFVAAVAALPEGIPDLCATASILQSRNSLMLVRADGSTSLLWTPTCGTVKVAGRSVEGSAVEAAFRESLDQQRDELDYTRPFAGVPCETSAGEGGPARPARETLVSACYSGKGDPVTLDDVQLAALRAAWADPKPVTEQLNEHTENDCTEGGDGTAIFAGTDRSDVVRMYWSPCGYLVWDSWEPGGSLAIPITLEELGLR